MKKRFPIAENATKTDPKADPAKAKAGVAQMLTNEGNAYLKLKKNDKAIAAYTKAAAWIPILQPRISISAQHNTTPATRKVRWPPAIRQLPPIRTGLTPISSRDHSWWVTASWIKTANSKRLPEHQRRLNKYLELAPDGPHANDVKAMLQAIGAKIETTYHEKKKK